MPSIDESSTSSWDGDEGDGKDPKSDESEESSFGENPEDASSEDEELEDVEDDDDQTSDEDDSPRVSNRSSISEAHKQSISRANSGRAPWNKGRTRSQNDKNNIAAGVRQRNRTILLAKLEHFGMTEKEWTTRQKQISNVREQLRRARLKDAPTTKQEKPKPKPKPAPKPKARTARRQSRPKKMIKKNHQCRLYTDSNFETGDILPSIFRSRDVTFRPSPTTEDGLATGPCPTGGPGGLICCSDCSQKYHTLLSSTVSDVESSKIGLVSKEIRDLLGFAKTTDKKLDEAVRKARPLAPPVPEEPLPKLEGPID